MEPDLTTYQHLLRTCSISMLTLINEPLHEGFHMGSLAFRYFRGSTWNRFSEGILLFSNFDSLHSQKKGSSKDLSIRLALACLVTLLWTFSEIPLVYYSS